MEIGTTEERLAVLETNVELLQRQLEETRIQKPPKSKRGWRAIVGKFSDDPLYDEAMQLGHEWRAMHYDEETGS